MQTKYSAASAALRTGSGILRGFILTAGASAAATLTVYDNTSAEGTVLTVAAAPQGTSVVVTGIAAPFSTGLYAALTGTGASVTALID